jgi:cytochrome c oxidase cbb3-type subunit 2/cytochrome c oxidase cbb3-type subunit I/II
MSYLVASVAGVGFFILSVAWLGVWPARRLMEEASATAPEHRLALTPSEARGRLVYAREGCAYCHTQQIRFTPADIARFGAPTLAWETRTDTPHMLGTRRIGPDLSRTGGTRSEDWQLTHLYAPRSVVPASVMPSYRRLFMSGPDQPKQEARDLVAYLETLGRARELAGVEGDVRAVQASHAHMEGLAPITVLNASAARTRRTGDVPALPENGDVAVGAALYRQHCAACHGATGAGDGPGAAGLRPRPSNLQPASIEFSRMRTAEALWNGVSGTAMPAWRDRSRDELAAISAFVRSGLAGPAAVAGGTGRSVVWVPPTPAQLALGPGVYAANCAQCHGAAGGGDGSAAAQLTVAPTNFQRQRPSERRVFAALMAGVDGTMMAPWSPRLTADELMGVVGFVPTLYLGDRLAGEAARR